VLATGAASSMVLLLCKVRRSPASVKLAALGGIIQKQAKAIKEERFN
jgi:hypothetical protein